MKQKKVTYALSDRVFNRLRREAFKCGVSMAGLSRILMESALGMKSGINPRVPHIKRKRVVSDVTITIKKGVNVRINK